MPADVCIRLAGAAVQNFGTVLVGGTTPVKVQDLYSAGTDAMDLNEALIATNCKQDGGATLVLVSN